jgi:hypothetical protein
MNFSTDSHIYEHPRRPNARADRPRLPDANPQERQGRTVSKSRRIACRHGKNGYFGICCCDECSKIVIVTDEMRLKWLHTGGEKDAEGYEWGVYRVKWENGVPVSVLHTLSDYSDLDAEIRKSKLNQIP